MVKAYNMMIAKIGVLKSAADFLSLTKPQGRSDFDIDYNEPLLSDNRLKFCYIGGLLLKVDQMRFKKFMFRATRGKAYVKFYNLDVEMHDRLKGSNN